MRLRKLTINNYRSIKKVSLDCSPQVTLLGPNNHGKSNVLSALEFGLLTSAKPAEADFFAHRGQDESDLWIEMTFSELTDQEKNTFRRYLLSDGTVCIRKTARLQNTNVDTAYNGWTEEPEEDWLRSECATDYTTRDKINATPLRGLVPQSGRITKAQVEQAQQNYTEEHRAELRFIRTLEANPLLGQKNVGGGVLPEFFLIPAVRDLTEEIKIKATTTFGRLMNRAVREMAERDPRFAGARTQLETVINALNQRDGASDAVNELAQLEKNIEQELHAWGVRVNIEVTPPEIEKLFELGTNVYLDDGVRTTADRKGNGLQRAMMFALLRSWAAALRSVRASAETGEVTPRKQSDSIIFAMEEPELFLHPHAQRRLSASLREIANTPEHQVFLCTHSTHFVDLAHYKEVVLISKEDPVAGSRARQCTMELFGDEDFENRKKRFHMAEWINPDRGEMFFARRAIFVEGETEKVLLPFIAEKLGRFDADISIIDCGAKHNLPLYVTIAKAFSIPYLVIHDEDPLPDPIPEDWNENKCREKRRTFELNQQIGELVVAPLGSVEMFAPDFEGACGVSRSQGDKMGKALAALEHFEGLPADDVPKALVEIVEAVYS
jgi:CRISPR-associated exonuclease Cas4